MSEPAGPALEENSNTEPYRRYFSSGHYDRRYPAPNQNVLEHIIRLLPPKGRILDYGCGSGRYLIALRDHAGLCIGFDTSNAALTAFQKNMDGLEGTEHFWLLGPESEGLTQVCEYIGGIDLALCLFGVLSHVETAAARKQTLSLLRRTLLNRGGRLLISVPNRRRRFHREQRSFRGSRQIRYLRKAGQEQLQLSYRLYDEQDLVGELEGCGFEVESLHAESLFPESWISRMRWLGHIDKRVCRWLPPRLGYGILAVARPVEGPNSGKQI